MGLETQRLDSSIIMDQDEFRRVEPLLSARQAQDAADAADAAGARDPRNVNAHLTVWVEDVLAEPAWAHSWDWVWLVSHCGFEVSRLLFYRLLSALLAVPAAFLLGLMFAAFNFAHIWLVMPCLRGVLVLLPPARVVWTSLIQSLVLPLFTSGGKMFSSVRVTALDH